MDRRRAAFQAVIANQAPAFNPLTDVTSGTLKLWLESDGSLFQDAGKTTPATANNDPVGAWVDQAGTPHDATEATNKPLLKTNIVGSLPGILFDGTNDQLATAAFDSGIANAGYTLFISFMGQEPDTVLRSLFARGTYDPVFYSNGAEGQVKYYSGGNFLFATTLTATPTLLTLRRHTSNSRVRCWINSVEQTPVADPTLTVDPATWGNSVLTIGGNGAGTQPFDNYIFAVGLYAGELSDANRVAVENYFLKKLALV